MCACVLSVDVGFYVFLGPQGGRAACCFVLGHRRPPGGNKSSTCNSEQSQLACVLTNIHLGFISISSTKDGGGCFHHPEFVGSLQSSFHCTDLAQIYNVARRWSVSILRQKVREKKMWFHCQTGLNYHLIWFKTFSIKFDMCVHMQPNGRNYYYLLRHCSNYKMH